MYLFFSNILKDLINNLPKDRLKKQKLMCVNDLIHSELFRFPGKLFVSFVTYILKKESNVIVIVSIRQIFYMIIFFDYILCISLLI